MEKIVHYGCGLNINNQLHFDRRSYICCPVELPLNIYKKHQSSAEPLSVSISHIIWRFDNDIILCGHGSKNFNDIISSVSELKVVKSSESRLVLVKEDEILICTSNATKKLHFQYNKDQVKEFNSDNEVTDVAVEDNSLLTVNKNGQLFNCGIEMRLPNMKIVNVCVGKEHCLALTSEGEVLSWGSGMKGQLGNGEIVFVEHPEKVEALEGLKIVSIECGGWHSIALSDSGDVYLWGWNDVGQLGLPSKSLRSPGVKWDESFENLECHCHTLNRHERFATKKKKQDGDASERKFQLVDSLRLNSNLVNIQTLPKLLEFWSLEIPVKKIACGDRHTAFLLENGTAWTTGWNLYGQLGIGSNISQDEPQMVLVDNVEDIHAGGWNTIFAVSEGVKR